MRGTRRRECRPPSPRPAPLTYFGALASPLAAIFGVVADQHFGLLVVHGQALEHGGFAVVVALDQRLAGFIVHAFHLGRVELDVVGWPEATCTRRPDMRSTISLSGTSISTT